MSTSMPRVVRASSAALVALAFAACSDSTAPANTIPNAAQAEQAASFIAEEINNSLSGLTVDAAMSAPTAAALARSAPSFNGGAALRAECGAWNPATPTDGDADGIPDALTITFTLPDCHYADDVGGSTDITGSMHIEDESAVEGSMSFSLGLTNLKVTFNDPENGAFSITQNGTGSVTHATSSLTQTHNFTTGFSGFGVTGSVEANWTNDFDATGGSIVAGEPLPDGTFTPSGTTSWRQGPNHFTFSLSAPTPLAYSASCAADLASANPFTSGTVRANITGSEGSAYVDIVYADCAEPTITYHGSNVVATVTR